MSVELFRKWLSGMKVAKFAEVNYREVFDCIDAKDFSFRVLPEVVSTNPFVFCRPCEARGIVEMCKRNQIEREKIVLIGFLCEGDGRDCCSRCDVRFSEYDVFFCGEYVFFKEESAKIVSKIPEIELLKDSSDVIGEAVKRYEKVIEGIEGAKADVKFDVFELSKRCMKCMGCVFECPICVCTFCSAKYLTRGEITPPQFLIFRMLHVADSCVNCGRCDEACCAGINLSEIFHRLQKKFELRTGFVPGIDYAMSPKN